VILLLTLACGSTPPTVTSVDPNEVLPGTEIKILGEDFAEPVTVTLMRDGQGTEVPSATFRGALLVEATLPETLDAGTYAVRVSAGDVHGTLPAGLTVLAPAVEAPCSGEWKSNAQVTRARELVIIDRFKSEEERDTHRIPFADIAQWEFERVKLDGDELCSVIYVRKKDGIRIPFDDDTRVNLEARVYKLGTATGHPAKVTRSDVDEDPRPMEQD
jgi:hypothetical protein